MKLIWEFVDGEDLLSKALLSGGTWYVKENGNGLVLIEDEKIVYAGKDNKKYDDYEIIDVGDKTIMPGLIDAHLHFSGNLSDDDTDWVTEPNGQKAIIAEYK